MLWVIMKRYFLSRKHTFIVQTLKHPFTQSVITFEAVCHGALFPGAKRYTPSNSESSNLGFDGETSTCKSTAPGVEREV